jgi:hypothetical protein
VIVVVNPEILYLEKNTSWELAGTERGADVRLADGRKRCSFLFFYFVHLCSSLFFFVLLANSDKSCKRAINICKAKY